MYQRIDISSYYRNCADQVRVAILQENDETIIGTEVDELAEYYYQKFALSPIEFDDTKEPTWEHKKYVERIPAHQRERFYSQDGDLDIESEKINVEIPIHFNEKLKTIINLQSSTRSLSYSEDEFSFSDDKIYFSIKTKGYGFNFDENKIASEVMSHINRAEELVGWKNSDINRENPGFKQNIINLINERKQKLKQDEDKISSLTKIINISLKKKETQNNTISLTHRPIIKIIKPTPTQPEEYSLDDKTVYEILSFLDNQGKQLERTPSSYRSLGEEELRDIFLVNLNSIFAGKATGETFSKKGKTDIYLNIDKGNILIFECKIWKGEKIYQDTIDQIRKYLTWRHNYGVIIFFVRNKNFSDVLKGVDSAITSSKSYTNGLRKIDNTHFASNHILDNDSKNIELHHLFYNLYSD